MDQATAADRHPYRGKPVALAPGLDGHERRLAAHGVSIVLICLLCRLPVLAFSPLAILAFELVFLLGIWLFTLRCNADSRVTRSLGWAFRLLAIVESMFAIARVLEIPWWSHGGSLYNVLIFAVVPAVGILFLAARLHGFGLVTTARRVLWVLASCLAGWLVVFLGSAPYELVIPYLLVGLPAFLGAWIWVFVVMLRLRRTLKVELQEWWLDLEARPRVEWTSYALLGDQRVELVGPDGKISWYDNHMDANAWLSKRGFCPRDRAIREHLIVEGTLTPAPGTRVTAG